MPEPIDLSTLKTDPPVTPEEDEALNALADRLQQEMDVREAVHTGFQILTYSDGRIVLDPTVDSAKYKTAKPSPGLNDMYNALTVVLSDLESQKIAQHVLMAMEQQAQAAFAQRQMADIQRNLHL